MAAKGIKHATGNNGLARVATHRNHRDRNRPQQQHKQKHAQPAHAHAHANGTPVPMSWILERDYASAGPATQDDLDGILSTLGTHTSQITTLNGQQAVQDGNIAAATTKNAEQDGRLDVVEAVAYDASGQIGDIYGRADWGTTPASGQVLRANGLGQYVPQTLALSSLGDVDLAPGLLSDGQALVYNQGLGKWRNAAVASSLAGLTDVQSSPLPVNGQLLQYVSATSKWTPTTVAVTSSIGGASDAALSSLLSGDVLVWSSATSKWQNSTRLTAAEQALGRVENPNASVTLSTTNTVCAQYQNALPIEGVTQNTTVTDTVAPFCYLNRASDYNLLPTNYTATNGGWTPSNANRLWEPTGTNTQSVSLSSGYARANCDLGVQTLLAATTTLTVTQQSGGGYVGTVRLFGSNNNSALTDTVGLTATGGVYTLIAELVGIGYAGGVAAALAGGQGPWRYLTIVVSAGSNTGNANLHAVVRAAAGGYSGQSALAGAISLSRAPSGLPVITQNATLASGTVNVDLSRLGLYLLYKDLLRTIPDNGTVRVGGWKLSPGANSAEISLLNDKFDPSTNTTSGTLGFSLRTSTQGGKNYLIVRPSGNAGMCLGLCLDGSAVNDPGLVLFPNSASGATGVSAVFRMNGDLFLAGITSTNQAGLLGTLDPRG